MYEQSTPTRRVDRHTHHKDPPHLPCIVPQVVEGQRHICNAAEENGLAIVLCSRSSSSSGSVRKSDESSCRHWPAAGVRTERVQRGSGAVLSLSRPPTTLTTRTLSPSHSRPIAPNPFPPPPPPARKAPQPPTSTHQCLQLCQFLPVPLHQVSQLVHDAATLLGGREGGGGQCGRSQQAAAAPGSSKQSR